MLLVCPNCSARYLITSTSLGEQGKDVRCAKCTHEWFQEPEELPVNAEPDVFADTEVEEEAIETSLGGEVEVEESVEEILEDLEEEQEVVFDDEEESSSSVVDVALEDAIPDAVKPRHDEAINVPALAKDVLRTPASLQAKVTGYFAALAVFGILLSGGILFKQRVVSLWPPAAAVYSLAGMSVSYAGEELVMESLIAQVQKNSEGRDFLRVQGRVINLTNEAQGVPKLFARLRSTNGEDGEGWSIDSPLETLEPGESFTFKSDYEALPRGIGSVNISFVPTVSL